METNEDVEVRTLDQRIDEVTDETLDSTRRILRTAEETNQIGVDTLITLNEQGEKIDNVERRLDEMNVDLKVTDKNIRELESICGCCYCPCGKPRSVQGTKQYKKTFGKKAKKREDIINQQPLSGGGGGGQKGGAPEGGYIKRVTGDEREEEMDQNLTAVGGILDNLHGIATDMGDELDRQNDQLIRVNRKAHVNVGHLGSANDRMRRQL